MEERRWKGEPFDLWPSIFALSLRELEPLAGLRTARLLALDCARIAREQAEIAKLSAMRFVELHERTRDCETERAGLTGRAAAVDVRLHVEAAERVSRRERLLNRRDERRTREVVAERAPVDVPLAGASCH